MRATLKGTRSVRLRRPLYFCDDLSSSEVKAIAGFRTAARRVCVARYDAQGVGRGDRRMREDAGRALKSALRGVHCTFVMTGLRRRFGVAVFPDGRRVVSGVVRQDAQGVGRGDGRVRGDAGRAPQRSVRCGPCTFVMIWLRRRSMACRCFRTARVG